MNETQKRFLKFVEDNSDLALTTSVLDCQIAIRRLLNDLAAAREEIARLKEDSGRMDWLEENPEAGEPYIVYHPPSGDITWRISATGREFQSLRAAIDAARAGGTR